METIKMNLNDFKGLQDAAEMYDWIISLVHVLWDREAEYIATCHDIQTGCCDKREEDEDPAAVLENLRMCYNLTADEIADRIWPIRQISQILKEVHILLQIVSNAEKTQLRQTTQQPAPQSDNETRLKNAAFAFLTQKGLYDEFEEFLHDPELLKGETVEDRIKIAKLYSESHANAAPVPSTSEAVAAHPDTVCVNSEALDNVQLLTAMVKDLHAEQVHNEKLLARCRDLMRARGISDEEINQQSE